MIGSRKSSGVVKGEYREFESESRRKTNNEEIERGDERN
jgi:hypothetical protein